MTLSQTVNYSSGPGISHSLTIAAEQQHLTDFIWTFSNWSTLYDENKRANPEGVTIFESVSDSFQVAGLENCTCRISFRLFNTLSMLRVEFSDSIDVVALKLICNINDYRYESFHSHPKEKYFETICSPFDKKYGPITISNIVDRSKPSLLLTVRFEVTTFPESYRRPYKKAQTNVLKSLKTMYDAKIFSDITFVFDDDGKELTAHKAILAAQSEVFQVMFSSDMKEKHTGRVEIDDIRSEVFEEFLRYLYTGEIYNLKNIFEEILVVADKYDVCHLKEFCENHMLATLSDENVENYLLIAAKYYCTELKKRALEMLQNSAKTIMSEIFEEK
ncbi:speckle-type POZ protein-like B [Venturia canescens]|uniref:speckle-type POZ protein-like B n=1 Tax=Venturia canescens TaxID=32260 RepID=UPI001C9D4E0C|nr:speckle-type POZ protein-like B [Venturia canescens]